MVAWKGLDDTSLPLHTTADLCKGFSLGSRSVYFATTAVDLVARGRMAYVTRFNLGALQSFSRAMVDGVPCMPLRPRLLS